AVTIENLLATSCTETHRRIGRAPQLVPALGTAERKHSAAFDRCARNACSPFGVNRAMQFAEAGDEWVKLRVILIVGSQMALKTEIFSACVAALLQPIGINQACRVVLGISCYGTDERLF